MIILMNDFNWSEQREILEIIFQTNDSSKETINIGKIWLHLLVTGGIAFILSVMITLLFSPLLSNNQCTQYIHKATYSAHAGLATNSLSKGIKCLDERNISRNSFSYQNLSTNLSKSSYTWGKLVLS